jgi:hypothetical protein
LKLDMNGRRQGRVGIVNLNILHASSVPDAPIRSIVTLNTLEGQVDNLHIPRNKTIHSRGHCVNRLHNSSLARLDTSRVLVGFIPELGDEVTLLKELLGRAHHKTKPCPTR